MKELETTLILQSVNVVTNFRRNKKEKHFFSVFIKYTAAHIESRDKKHSQDQGSSFATILGSGIKIQGVNVGSVGKKYTLL